MKMPNLSACAGSPSPTVTQVAIETATDTSDAAKQKFDNLFSLFIFPPFEYNVYALLNRSKNIQYHSAR